VGALAGGAVAAYIAYHFAGSDVNKAGDWRNGAARFIGMAAALGIALGYFVTLRIVAGKRVTRDGFTLTYKSPAPTAEGYREMSSLAVRDLASKLAAHGYAPRLEACNEVGERAGTVDPSAALQGANIAILDPHVRGWIRVSLAPWRDDQPRAMGLVEIWSESGESAEELAMFTLRALDTLVDDLKAARDSSALSADSVAMLTAGVPDRPRAVPSR
jgi:hypothetical protein